MRKEYLLDRLLEEFYLYSIRSGYSFFKFYFILSFTTRKEMGINTLLTDNLGLKVVRLEDHNQHITVPVSLEDFPNVGALLDLVEGRSNQLCKTDACTYQYVHLQHRTDHIFWIMNDLSSLDFTKYIEKITKNDNIQ